MAIGNMIMKIEKGIDENYNLYNQLKDISTYYQFFDFVTNRFTGNKDISIRQIVDEEELALLSEARKKMYDKHSNYFKKLYQDDVYIDDIDYRSYIFACYYQGEIIGTQRATRFPFEVSNYLNTYAINQFLGNNFQSNYESPLVF